MKASLDTRVRAARRGGCLPFLAILPAVSAVAAPAPSAQRPAIQAVRVEVPPRVDGSLDDAAWLRAPPVSDFLQRSPTEGAPPTERTEVRLVYDDKALYVAVHCFDGQASTLRPRLGRRDNIPQSDTVRVSIDSHFDRKSAFSFLVNSAGVQADSVIADGTDDNTAWDGVWTAEVRIGRDGWTAEFRIPFATLRFPHREAPTFGIHVRRFVNRIQEVSEWPLIPSGSTSFVGSFAVVSGLRGIRPQLHLEVLPYGLVQWNASFPEGSLAPRRALEVGAGFDAKYGIGGQLTLDLSFNPDFGQVEADPAVINLTAVETFYEEKRPFFVEGAEIFSTPFRLLHTRRIGAPPPDPEPRAEEGTVVSVDRLPRILGAAKLSGRLAPGTSVGILSALVDAAYALEDVGGVELRRTASPLSHFGAFRLRQQLGGPSSAGFMATLVQRASPEDMLPSSPTGTQGTVSADVDLRGSSPYGLTAQLAASLGTCDEDRKEQGKPCVPLGAYVRAGRTAGQRFRLFVVGSLLPPDFDMNPTGYQPYRDMYQLYTQATFRTPKPFWLSATNEHTLYAYTGWNTARYHTAAGVGHTGVWRWKNQWFTMYDFGVDFPRYDPLETRYGRIPYHRPSAPWFYLYQTSDESRPVAARLEGIVIREGGSWEGRVTPTLLALLGQRLQLTLKVGYRFLRNRDRWVETVTVDHIDHYVFGRINHNLLDTTLRVTATLSRNLTLQCYAQLLHGAGSYPGDSYRELLDPKTLGPLTVPYSTNADFTHTSLIANAVLRWEYRPLSTLYLVWTHAASIDAGSTAGTTQRPGDFSLGAAFRDLANVPAGDTVMLKLTYLMQL